MVQASLARDGLHVAMVAHDRDRLQAYAAILARTLAAQTRLRVEAYHPSRLESVVVDLMLHRFDAALSDISGSGLSGNASAGQQAAGRPGCVLFVPDAHALPRAEFRQLLRIAAGTHRNGLRLVALFDANSASCDERIAELGAQVARWDIDDDGDARATPASMPWRRRRADDALTREVALSASRAPSRLSSMSAMASLPRAARRLVSQRNSWLAAASVAALLLTLPAVLTWQGDASLQAQQDGHDQNRTVTRSGMVELAGEPRQDFVRAAASETRLDSQPDTVAGGRREVDPEAAVERSLDGRIDAVEAVRRSAATATEMLSR